MNVEERITARPLLPVVVLALIASALYANSLWNEFVFDDRFMIVEHEQVKHPSNLRALLTSGHRMGEGSYRPMVTVSFALNHLAGGLNPFGYHLVNLLLHALAGVLVYLVVKTLFDRAGPALVAALLFAVHPVHTEAVTPGSGRADLLAAVFFLAAWWMYAACRKRDRMSWPLLLGSLLAYLLAMFSKQHALTLPAVLVLSDGLAGSWKKVFNLRALRIYATYAAVAAVYLLVYIQVRGNFLNAPGVVNVEENPLAEAGLFERVLTTIQVVGHYLWLMIWPLRLSPDYSYAQVPVAQSLGDPGVLFGLAMLLPCIALPLVFCESSKKAWLGVLFFGVTLAPTTNLLVTIGTIMGERHLYLPSVGLCLLAACVTTRAAAKHSRITYAVLTLVLVLFSARTVLRNRDWKDEYTLWRSAVKVVPRSGKVRNNLAYACLEKGLLDDAIREYNICLKILPDDKMAHLNLGQAYLRNGNYREAVLLHRKAVEKFPGEVRLHVNLGVSLALREQWPEAEAALRNVLRRDPGHREAKLNLERVLQKSGR